MNIGIDRPISLITEVGIRHIHQPLKSTSTRRCSQEVERSERFAKLCPCTVDGAGPQNHFHGARVSPYACMTERS